MTGPGAPARHASLMGRRDPVWLDWLAQHTEALDRFYTTDVPGLPADRYSTAGLRAAEHALLAVFTEGTHVPEEQAVADRFGRYLGEVFVQSLHGQWINDPLPHTELRPVVRFPYSDIRLSVDEQIDSALYHRTGTQWQAMHAMVSGHAAFWWESGRDTRHPDG